MIIRYGSPFQDIDTIRRQFDRLFDDFTPAATVAKTWTPAIRLSDRGDHLELQVLIPGITAEDIDIQASRDTIAISGESRHAETEEDHTVLYNEVRDGTYRRIVNLPVEVEPEAIAADYTNGILTLTLPKVAAERNKVVKVALTPSAER